MIRRLLIALVLVVVATGGSSAQDDSKLRVRLFAGNQLNSVEFASLGPDSLTVVEDGQIVAVLPPDEPAVVETWQGMLRVRWSRGSAPLTHCRLESASVIQVLADDRPDRVYRGAFEAMLDESGGGGLQLVNIVNIQHYVASVLPAEYPFTEIEGVKAQAIVIRSYAISVAPRDGSWYSLRDDAGSQVYRGVESETDLSRDVARLTSGSNLLYRGKTVEAVYSSHCGGHSANNEDIWGTGPIPYLRGRKDPYDGEAPVAEWSTSTDVERVHEQLSKRLGKQVKALRVSQRGAGKHVSSVKLSYKDSPDETMRGERFRSLVNSVLGSQLIRSSSFEIDKRSDTYRFKGKGYGHGVGLCQWGTRAQAQQGRSYKDILRFYYQGVDITEGEPDAVAFHTPDVTTTTTTPAEPNQKPATISETQPTKRRPGW